MTERKFYIEPRVKIRNIMLTSLLAGSLGSQFDQEDQPPVGDIPNFNDEETDTSGDGWEEL